VGSCIWSWSWPPGQSLSLLGTFAIAGTHYLFSICRWCSWRQKPISKQVHRDMLLARMRQCRSGCGWSGQAECRSWSQSGSWWLRGLSFGSTLGSRGSWRRNGSCSRHGSWAWRNLWEWRRRPTWDGQRMFQRWRCRRLGGGAAGRRHPTRLGGGVAGRRQPRRWWQGGSLVLHRCSCTRTGASYSRSGFGLLQARWLRRWW
jgi:hypothetical protein